MSQEQITHLDPSKVLAEGNSRFGLKKARLDSLKESILELGGVQSPVGVEPLPAPVNGHTHKLVYGFYRHAAVEALNKENGAGLTLPAIVRKPADSAERLKHQLAENMERENQSPMDQAVAIKQLMDAGVPRLEIRRIFARPGGKKGAEIQPASNAWLNIVLRFLELPKTVQSMIHEGVIGVEAAYELGKVPPDKRAAVIERAKAEREKQLATEAKDEEKYLEAEKKLTTAQEQEKEAVSKVDETKAAIEAAEKLRVEKQTALEKIQGEPYMKYSDEQKAEMKERLKAAEADVKGADKLVKDTKNELAKLLQTATKAAETAKAQREKLEAARKAVKAQPKKKAEIGKADVKAAAAKEGVNTGATPLNMSEIRGVLLKDLGKLKEFPKVLQVADVFKRAIDGILTPKQAGLELAKLTGEAK